MAVQQAACAFSDIGVHEFPEEEKYLTVKWGDPLHNARVVVLPEVFDRRKDSFIDLKEAC